MSEIKLKPCPFCKRKNWVRLRHLNIKREMAITHKKNCAFRILYGGYCEDTVINLDDEKEIRSWNRRVEAKYGG